MSGDRDAAKDSVTGVNARNRDKTDEKLLHE